MANSPSFGSSDIKTSHAQERPCRAPPSRPNPRPCGDDAQNGRVYRPGSASLRGTSGTIPTPSSEGLAIQIRSVLNGLGAKLQGPERDAVRARDLIRSFVDRVVIQPLDEPGGDNARTGPTRITIEGPISALVDEALLVRKIPHSRGAEAMQNLPSPIYRIYMDVTATQLPARAQIAAAAVVIDRLLDDADAPVLRSAMRDAVEKTATSENQSLKDMDRRARVAFG